MEPKPLADNGVEVTSGFDDKAARRRQSAFARRKSSAVVEESAAIVEAHTLNDADRRLAEMGYTQVSRLGISKNPMLTNTRSSRSTSENSLGCQPSPLPSQSRVSSPVSRPPSSIPSKQVVLPPPSGHGSYRVSDATVLRCPWPNSSPPTLHPEDYTSRANTLRRKTGYRKYHGCAVG